MLNSFDDILNIAFIKVIGTFSFTISRLPTRFPWEQNSGEQESVCLPWVQVPESHGHMSIAAKPVVLCHFVHWQKVRPSEKHI